MVIRSGRENMVGCFFREDLGKVGIFQWERDFRFCFLGGNSECSCHSELGNNWGVWEKAFTVISKDPVDKMVVQRMLEVLVLHVMV